MVRQADTNTIPEKCSEDSSSPDRMDIIRDIYCGPEVLFETCVAMKFVDDDAGGENKTPP